MNHIFHHKGFEIKYELIYRKRKTAEIRVIPPNNVRLIVPIKTKGIIIKEILLKRGDWILNKLNDLKDKEYEVTEKKFFQGEKFLLKGKEYSLSIKVCDEYKKCKVYVCDNQLIVNTKKYDKELIKKSIIKWYKAQGLDYINERINYYSDICGKVPNEVKVKEQKRRWGSCSSKGKLMFNWRIIMAPVDVIDYIVVHEMCHLIHLNHSKEYWNLVSSIMYNYKEKKLWLKNNGIKLNI